MGHDWVFDVLSDLRDYALANGFGGLAAKAEEAMVVAAAEVTSGNPQPAPPQPERDRPH